MKVITPNLIAQLLSSLRFISLIIRPVIGHTLTHCKMILILVICVCQGSSLHVHFYDTLFVVQCFAPMHDDDSYIWLTVRAPSSMQVDCTRPITTQDTVSCLELVCVCVCVFQSMIRSLCSDGLYACRAFCRSCASSSPTSSTSASWTTSVQH